jgi:2,3-bisphosphoglycerate-dependent phosphoglycerate mutase
LHSKGSKIDVAFYLNISDEEAVQRVRQRNRPDDEPQAIASRVEQFHRDTQPVLEEMLRDGIAVPIESSAPMEVVQKQIADKLQEINGKLDPKRQLKPRTSDEVILRVVSQSEPKVEGEFRTLFVITHSESDYNKKGIFTGLTEVELTEEGHKKAELSAQILRKEKIDLVVKTSMIRTGQTLEHIMKYHPDTKVETDDRFIERDYGELSGLSKDQYAKDHPDLYPIYHRSYDVPPPGGESMKSVEERALAALHEILDRIKKDKINVLIVCHSNSIRPIRRYFEHLTPEEMMQLEHLRHQIFTYKIPV